MRSSFIIFSLAFSLVLMCVPTHAGTISEVSAHHCGQMQLKHVIKNNPPVNCDRLRIVRFSYLDFDGHLKNDGEVMVLDAAAEQVLEIFEALRNSGFRIKQARLMQHYSGNDTTSMSDNNTSGFNHRQITNGMLPSLHAYGLAIDLNPVQNPYMFLEKDGYARFSPSDGIHYANRLNHRPGKKPRQGMAEESVHIFAIHGFSVWGGYWDNPIDYQHFQVPRNLAEKLIRLPEKEAKQLFKQHVATSRKCLKKSESIFYIPEIDASCSVPNHSNE